MSTPGTKTIPIAVFASGRGSNFDAIHSAIRAKQLDAEIVAVVSDQPNSLVLEKARRAGLKTLAIEAEKGASARKDHEEKILKALKPLAPKFLVMAGYMRIVTPHLLDAFRSERGYNRVVNIHPSLLPAFPGVDAYARAFNYGAKITGVTVHLVDEEVDGGPVCVQESFLIGDCRSVSEVESWGLALEHRLFPKTLSWVLPEEFEIDIRSGQRPEQRRICVRSH